MTAELLCTVLVVEDHLPLQEEMVAYLNLEGFASAGCASGEELDEWMSLNPVDIVLLDLNLPVEDGLAIAARLRRGKPGIGIVMLTGRKKESSVIDGYNSGADFYLTKPPCLPELVGVLKALSMRVKQGRAETGYIWHIHSMSLTIQAPDGLNIALNPSELKLLRQLTLASGNTLEIWQILDLFNLLADDSNKARIEVLVSRLRKKLAVHNADEPVIKSIRNFGYHLCIDAVLVE